MSRARTPSRTLETMLAMPEALEASLAANWTKAARAAERLKGRRVLLAGSGTSFHAAWAGAHMLRGLAGAEAWPIQALELALYPPRLGPRDAVIVISHRGTKHYSQKGLDLARDAGALCLGVAGKGSGFPPLELLLETVPQETSSAHTASYLGSLAALAQLAYACGPGLDAGRQALAPLPDLLRKLLSRAAEVEAPAARALAARRVIAVGAGPNAATAAEGALKLIEMAHLPAQASELETFLHGPLAAVEKEDFVILVAAPGPALDRGRQLLRALAELGTPVWCVGETLNGVPSFELPKLPEELSPILAAAPLQLLAHAAAAAKGVNPDLNRKDEEPYRRASEIYAS